MDTVPQKAIMRKRLLCLLACPFGLLILTCGAAAAASGPEIAWNVFTLPNPEVTPNWRTYASEGCATDPEACAQNHRFWEEWDFSNFQNAIDTSFAAVNSLGKYQAVMMILPLGDTPTYWNNIRLMYQLATVHGVQLEAVLFPKWKYGSEYCYLYKGNAPSGCQLVPGTTTALAYQKLRNLMNFVQNLSGACAPGSYNSQFAVWYGWTEFSPGYVALKNFWRSLPTKAPKSGCNLQASYITWLDSGFAGTSEVQRVQTYATQLSRPYWVNTELYSTSQIQQYYATYAPYQTIITGYWGATDITNWAQGMCAKWNTALQPVRLGVWPFFDRDVSPIEQYRSYINGSMAVVGSLCAY